MREFSGVWTAGDRPAAGRRGRSAGHLSTARALFHNEKGKADHTDKKRTHTAMAVLASLALRRREQFVNFYEDEELKVAKQI